MTQTEFKYQHLRNKIARRPILDQGRSTNPCLGSQTINIASISEQLQTWSFLQISIAIRWYKTAKLPTLIFKCIPRKSLNQHADLARDSECFEGYVLLINVPFKCFDYSTLIQQTLNKFSTVIRLSRCIDLRLLTQMIFTNLIWLQNHPSMLYDS